MLSKLNYLNISLNYFNGPIPIEIIELMATEYYFDSDDDYEQPEGYKNRTFSYDQYNMIVDGGNYKNK